MKRAVSVSLGSPSRDKKVIVNLNGMESALNGLEPAEMCAAPNSFTLNWTAR
jgi:hypothetical protein